MDNHQLQQDLDYANQQILQGQIYSAQSMFGQQSQPNQQIQITRENLIDALVYQINVQRTQLFIDHSNMILGYCSQYGYVIDPALIFSRVDAIADQSRLPQQQAQSQRQQQQQQAPPQKQEQTRQQQTFGKIDRVNDSRLDECDGKKETNLKTQEKWQNAKNKTNRSLSVGRGFKLNQQPQPRNQYSQHHQSQQQQPQHHQSQHHQSQHQQSQPRQQSHKNNNLRQQFSQSHFGSFDGSDRSDRSCKSERSQMSDLSNNSASVDVNIKNKKMNEIKMLEDSIKYYTQNGNKKSVSDCQQRLDQLKASLQK